MDIDTSLVEGIVVSTWNPDGPRWLPDQRDVADTLVPFVRVPDGKRPWSVRSDDYRPASDLRAQIQATLGRALKLTSELARRVAVLHDHGWIYGRIGPGTVWVNRTLDGVALLPLLPFREGVPLLPVEQERLASGRDTAPLAPELRAIQSSAPSRSLDFFGLGAFLFWACTGRAQLNLPVVPSDLSEVEMAGLELVAEVINRLASAPGRPRYATARGVAADLNECLQHLGSGGALGIPALGQQDGAPGITFGSSLIGREGELDALRRIAQNARRNAAAAFVTGPPGVGKTRLVQELERVVLDGRGVFVGGKSDQFAMEEPLSSLTKSLGSLARWVSGQPPASRRRWGQKLRAELIGLESVICALEPAFATLLEPKEAIPEIGPEQQINRFKDAVVGLFRAFANRNRLLCVFLDDMQWADKATLELIEMLMGDPSLSGLLFVGAFRDNEPAHRVALAQAEKALARCHPAIRVELTGLEFASVSTLVDRIVGKLEDERVGLVRYLHERTGGNPFYLQQVVDALIAKRLIWYDFRTETWRWQLDAILAQDTGADVANIVARRLAELSDDARRLLATAAFLGASFPQQMLARASALPAARFGKALGEALAMGAIQVTGDDELAIIQFVHDRVQSAATSLVDPEEVQQFRHSIGHALLESIEDFTPRSLFVIVNNINQISDDLNPDQRIKLATLNLVAGQRARETLAFDEAFHKLAAGIRLLPVESWQTNRPLSTALHLESFRAAYQSGRFDDAQQAFDLLMRHVTDALGAAEVYNTKILLETAAQRNNEAVDAAVVALGKLGWRLNKTISRAGIIVEFVRLRWLMRSRPVESFVELREMDDVRRLRALTILTSVSPAAYFVNPNLTILAGLKIVAISVRAGNSPLSPSGYVLFGLGHVALGAYSRGDALGRLALSLAERLPDPATRPKVQIIYGAFVCLWQHPIQECLAVLRTGYEGAVAVGDRQYAHYAVLLQWFLNFFRGRDLEVLEADFRKQLHFVNQSRDPFVIGSYAIWSEAIALLRDQPLSGEPIMNSPAAGDAFVEKMRASNNLTAVGYYLVMKLQLECLFGSPEAALGYGDRARRYLDAMPGQIMLADYAFYRAIAAAMLGRRLGLLRRGLRKFRRFATMAPANFRPHLLLLEAEAMAISGAGGSLSAYEAAIEAADAAGMPNIAGLAALRASETCVKLGSSRSRHAYLEEARKRFVVWKATALARRVVAGVADVQWAEAAQTRTVVERGRTGAIEHVLSMDHDDSRRVPELLLAAAQEARADEAWLVSMEGPQLAVVAQCRDRASTLTGSRDTRIEHQKGLRGEILNLVRRTGRDLVIPEMATDARFASKDGGVSEGMVYCGVCRSGGTALALLYLTSGEPARLSDDLLRALGTATAEFASALMRQRSGRRLDDHQVALRRSAKKLQLMEHLRQQLEPFATKRYSKALLELNDLPIDAQQECIVSSLFLDIQGYTQIVEALGARKSKLLVEEYFSAFYDEILKMNGDIIQSEGDSLLAIFNGEESAPNAVASAAAVRTAVCKLNITARYWPNITVNIGINTGEAIHGHYEFGPEGAKRKLLTAVGSSVNVAARIASHARDGAILIGSETRKKLPPTIKLVARGTVQFKNVSEPIEVFEVEE